ncbi:N-acylneuraminate cytidylyltransferase/CMP-N,N'-diacetyllegionaminic acid synthase [Flavobacterium fluvii]|uniref:N-acylneuraminate cytidylyltransferase/CMP-N,N'-diacetyllegionaminic acid synthase n=1 Tax=Flavobacterium fluvii TaxID=468056 RepID=A0A1M5IQQ0_9FLAO|nr:acylneuraminate cytidylyltransferase family protein [Flavobacterium fluvii]SHG30637.1 N-acylneuraminate cytidylyltransferase/CMP-N,N'-diacetyllegionaminic acid synthase [Flavobacterium fluvii]
MKILAIIPARGSSKGVPGKNIKLLNGKPLLTYTSEIALQSNYLTEVIVSTEDERIREVAKKVGLKVPFIRPVALAQDDTPTIDVIIHALQWYEKQNSFFDAVCLLQVTSPFRTLDFLDKAIERFYERGCDSLVSVLKVPHEYNPHWTFEVNADGNLKIVTGEAEIIPRRQELPTAYHRDGSIYITKTEVLLKKHSLYGKSIAFIESEPDFYVNIDTMEDWRKAEEMIQKKLK